MANNVTIARKIRRGSIFDNAVLKTLKEGDDIDTDGEVVGAYDGMKYLGTSDTKGPIYEADSGRWSFKGTEKDLKNFVKDLGMLHEKGAKKGDLIKPEEVNFYNAGDPFFNHSSFKLDAVGGNLRMDSENPIHRFVNCCLLGQERVWSSSRSNPSEKADADYELLSEDYDDIERAKKIDWKVEAATFMGKLSKKRLVQVVRAINHIKLHPKNDITEESLKRGVYEYIIEQGEKTVDAEGVPYIEKFVNFAKMEPAELELLELLSYGMRKGIVSPRRDGKYYVFNSGSDQEEMKGVSSTKEAINFLKDASNIEVISFLRSKFVAESKK